MKQNNYLCLVTCAAKTDRSILVFSWELTFMKIISSFQKLHHRSLWVSRRTLLLAKARPWPSRAMWVDTPPRKSSGTGLAVRSNTVASSTLVVTETSTPWPSTRSSLKTSVKSPSRQPTRAERSRRALSSMCMVSIAKYFFSFTRALEVTNEIMLMEQ